MFRFCFESQEDLVRWKDSLEDAISVGLGDDAVSCRLTWFIVYVVLFIVYIVTSNCIVYILYCNVKLCGVSFVVTSNCIVYSLYCNIKLCCL